MDERIRVLVISGLYPNSSNKISGVFVKNRLERLTEMGVDPEIIVPITVESNSLQMAKRFFGKQIIKSKEPAQEDRLYGKAPTPMIVQVRRTLARKFFTFERTPEDVANSIMNSIVDLSKYDIVHAHRVFPEGCAVLSFLEDHSTPFVITAHGSDINYIPKKYPKAKPLLLHTLEAAKAVIFVSSSLLEAAKGLGYSGRNAEVVPNGVDTRVFSFNSNIAKKTENPSICFVGNFYKVKGADYLPRIFQIVKSYIPSALFTTVGEGPLKKHVISRCRKLGINTRFLDRMPQQELSRILQEMDLLIIPSRNEGWPCIVLEAQACGLAVVGSSKGGIPEAIGIWGRVVEDGRDFEERFAEAIVHQLEELPNKDLIRRRAEEFDWKNTVAREVCVYKKHILSSQCANHAKTLF